MKKFLTLPLLALAVVSAFSQKADLDEKKITVRYVQLPSNPLSENFESYSVALSANPGDLSAVGLTESFFTNNLVVPGYLKIAEGGNFNITLTLHDYKAGKGETKTKTTKTKDKSGKETSTNTYTYEAGFEHMLTLLVRSQENPKIEQRNWLEGTRTYTSKEYATTREVNDYLTSRQIGRDIARQDQDEIVSAMKSVRNYLASKYGYQEWTDYPKLMYLDSEKHPDYSSFLAAYNTAQKSLETLRPQLPLDSARALAQPAIEYFTKQKDTYDTAEKTGRKMKYACLFNLMTVHFWLEDFDKAILYANELIANDYDKKDGERMLKAIAELRQSLEACRRTTRHFVFEKTSQPVVANTPAPAATDAQPDAETQAISYQTDSEDRKTAYKEKALGLTPNTVRYEGTILGTDGKETAVLFLVENPRAVGLRFGNSGNIRYAIDKGNTYDVRFIDKNKVAQFSFEGKAFKIMSFRSANSVNLGGASKTVLEVVSDLATYSAYLAYSGDNEGLTNPPEYVIENKKEQSMTSLNGMKFALNINKGISKTFDKCPAVLEEAGKGTFKRNPEEITRLVKMLEACGQ